MQSAFGRKIVSWRKRIVDSGRPSLFFEGVQDGPLILSGRLKTLNDDGTDSEFLSIGVPLRQAILLIVTDSGSLDSRHWANLPFIFGKSRDGSARFSQNKACAAPKNKFTTPAKGPV